MNRWPARYFSGEAPTAIDVAVEVGSASIQIFFPQSAMPEVWPQDQLEQDDSQLGGVALFLAQQPKRKLILPITPEDRVRLFPRLGLELHRSRRKERRRWMLVILASLALVAALLLNLKAIGTFFAAMMPYKMEVAIFQKRKVFLECTLDAREKAALAQVLKEVFPLSTEDASYPVRLGVLRFDQPNAFALPGGRIYLTRALLRAPLSPEAIVGVLSHEIGHVQKRHNLQTLVASLLIEVLFAGAQQREGSQVSLLAQSLWENGYSRENEREADVEALVRLKRAAIDPQGLADFFSGLSPAGGSSKFDWLSSHPADQDRVRLVNESRQGHGQYRKIVWSPKLRSILKGICP